MPVRLRAADREALTQHFLSLGPEDQQLRFGAILTDDAICTLEERIDLDRDGIFGIASEDLTLLVVVHVAFYPGGRAELGFSVLSHASRQELGNTLSARAAMPLVNRDVGKVFVHCIRENATLLHIARKHGIRLVQEGGESDAQLVHEAHRAARAYLSHPFARKA